MNTLDVKPTWLTREEQDDPAAIVNEFFEAFSLEEVRRYNRDLYFAAAARSDEDLREVSRQDINFYYEELEKVMEAFFLLKAAGRFLTRVAET